MLITPENKVVLKKRFASFAWRTGDMLAVALLDFAATNLELFDLPPLVVVIAGLVLGEITKHLNKKGN